MNRTRSSLLAAATIGSVLAGGAAAFTFSTMATAADAPATTQSTVSAAAGSSAGTSASTGSADAADATDGKGGDAAHAAETPLAGDDLAKATAAATQAVPGATIDRAETDGDGGAAYEVHVTNADGSRATVKLNSDFSVASVDTDQGRGHGGKGGAGGPHQANGITETPLTGDDLAKATAAATTAEPGATIGRAETDAEGDAFEVHITKADGTRATVKLNSDFSVKTVEADQAGGGHGGRGGHGARGQAPASDAPATDQATSTTTN